MLHREERILTSLQIVPSSPCSFSQLTLFMAGCPGVPTAAMGERSGGGGGGNGTPGGGGGGVPEVIAQ